MTDTAIVDPDAERQAEAVSERLLLWHAEGHVDTKAKTAHDILKAAGLDWGVKMAPLFVTGPDGKPLEDNKRRAIVREDTHQILGVARSRYVPASQAELLSFLDTLVDDGRAKYEAAWQWRDGEAIGIAMRVPDDVLIAGFDPHEIHILARTSHDGSGSVVVAGTPVRINCTNMVTATIKNASRVFRATHTRSLDGRIADARNALDVVFSYTSAWDEAAKELYEASVTKDKVAKVAQELYGERHIEPVVDLWMRSDNIADFRNTRYGAYNALTEYGQWQRPRNPHLESALRGPIARQTDQAYQLLAV